MEFVGTESFGAIQQQQASDSESDGRNQNAIPDDSQNDLQVVNQHIEISDQQANLENNRYLQESTSKNDRERHFEGSPAGIGGSIGPSNGGLHDSFGMEAMTVGEGLASEPPNQAASLGASLSQSNQKKNVNQNSYDDQLGNEPKFSNSKNLVDQNANGKKVSKFEENSFSDLSIGGRAAAQQPQVMGSFGSIPINGADQMHLPSPKMGTRCGIDMPPSHAGRNDHGNGPKISQDNPARNQQTDLKSSIIGDNGLVAAQDSTNKLNDKQAALQANDTVGGNIKEDTSKSRPAQQQANDDEQDQATNPKNRHHAKPRNKSGKKTRENKSKSIGHYLIGKTIGEGTFGKVRLGTHNLTGEKVAVKILEKHKIVEDVDVERVAREIKILKLARHPNIIQLYEIIETPRQLYLITEYVPGGELFDYIVKHQRLSEQEACKFYQQIISGIEYLHELGIVHRDMKPENLLLDHDGQIKLVDFGLSNTYKEGETLKTACGSPCYAAPEMIAGEAYHGARVDIWSCGVILFAMVCGYLPFEDPDTNILYKKILDGKFEIPQWVSSDCAELMNKILNIDPEERYTTKQIIEHSWYTQHNKPVIRNFGLIIGKNKIPLEKSIVSMLKQYGFKQEEAEQSLNANKHNQVTTIYYLLHKRYEKLGQLPSHFNIMKRPSNGDSVENQAERAEDKAAEGGSPQGPMTPGLFSSGQNTASMGFGGTKQPESVIQLARMGSASPDDDLQGSSRERRSKMNEIEPQWPQDREGVANVHKFESTPNKHQRGLQSLVNEKAATPDKFRGMIRENPRRAGDGEEGQGRHPDSPANLSGEKFREMDTQREIELSCSPVKRSRRKNREPLSDSINGSPREASRIPFGGFAGHSSGGQNHFENEYADNSRAAMDKKRAEKIEEKGSRSPDKKRRRALRQNDSLDSSSGNNFHNRDVHQQNPNLLQIRLLGSFDSQSRDQAGQNDLLQAAATGGSKGDGKEATGTVGDEGTSSMSYQPPGGDQSPIIIQKHLFGGDFREQTIDGGIALIGQGLGGDPLEHDQEPLILGQTQPEGNISMRPLRLRFEDTGDSLPVSNTNFGQRHSTEDESAPGAMPLESRQRSKNIEDDNAKNSAANKEYRKKIEMYKKDNYKYRNNGDERSIDDKLKTKLLLKNIAASKWLNRRSLLPPNGLNGGTTDGGAGDGGQARGSAAIPLAPKTTTAADTYENGGNQINIGKQNRRASSIDDPAIPNPADQDYQGCAQNFGFRQTTGSGAPRGEGQGCEAAISGSVPPDESSASQSRLQMSGGQTYEPKKVLNTTVKGAARRNDYQKLHRYQNEVEGSKHQLRRNQDQEYQNGSSMNSQDNNTNQRDSDYLQSVDPGFEQEYPAQGQHPPQRFHVNSHQANSKRRRQGLGEYQTAPQRGRNNFKRYHGGQHGVNAEGLVRQGGAGGSHRESNGPGQNAPEPSAQNQSANYAHRSGLKTRSNVHDEKAVNGQSGHKALMHTEQTPHRPTNYRSRYGNAQRSAGQYHSGLPSQNQQNHATHGLRKRLNQQDSGNGNNYGQSRHDPINFTNQYNIYNPVIGGPIASTPMNGPLAGPLGAAVGAMSPQPHQLQVLHQHYQTNQQPLSSSINLLTSNQHYYDPRVMPRPNMYESPHLLSNLHQLNLLQSQQINPSLGFFSQYGGGASSAAGPTPVHQYQPNEVQTSLIDVGLSHHAGPNNVNGNTTTSGRGDYPLQMNLSLNNQLSNQFANSFTGYNNLNNHQYISQSMSPPKKLRGSLNHIADFQQQQQARQFNQQQASRASRGGEDLLLSNQVSASLSGGEHFNDSVQQHLSMQQKSFLDADNNLLKLPMPQMHPLGGLPGQGPPPIQSNLSTLLLGQDAVSNAAALQGLLGSTDATTAALAGNQSNSASAGGPPGPYSHGGIEHFIQLNNFISPSNVLSQTQNTGPSGRPPVQFPVMADEERLRSANIDQARSPQQYPAPQQYLQPKIKNKHVKISAASTIQNQPQTNNASQHAKSAQQAARKNTGLTLQQSAYSRHQEGLTVASLAQNGESSQEAGGACAITLATKSQISKYRRRLFDHRSAKKPRDSQLHVESSLLRDQPNPYQQRAREKVTHLEHADEGDDPDQSRGIEASASAAEMAAPISRFRQAQAQW